MGLEKELGSGRMTIRYGGTPSAGPAAHRLGMEQNKKGGSAWDTGSVRIRHVSDGRLNSDSQRPRAWTMKQATDPPCTRGARGWTPLSV
jgi:hypothetical protein